MKATEIEIGVIKFIITELPKKEQLTEYETLLKNHQVDLLIRIVEKSLLYEINVPNLTVVDFTNFEDGSVPTKEIMDKYIKLIEDIKVKYTNPIVAIHCVSSLGRCPTFLGISMIIEHSKMDRYEIIIYIRKKRPGALNAKQVNWLIDVKIPSKKKSWEFWKK
jgi:protein tyrosine phosphatase type 4A